MIVASTAPPTRAEPSAPRFYDEKMAIAKLPVSELSDEELAYYFAIRWFSSSNYFRANRFMGIETLQNPLDVWITQEVIYEVQPDVIVETGTHFGGSALLWATILQSINPDARVFTVDIENRQREASHRPLWKRRVKFFRGSSTDPAIFQKIVNRTRDKRVLVILDSLHTPEHVKAELDLYSKIVPVGSYIIVQDTGIVRPLKASKSGSEGIDAFLAENDDFVIDSSRERFRLTNNPGGYLKRIQ